MAPMSLLVGAKADDWGRKPFYLAAFIVLPLRGLLYTLSDNSAWLVTVQLLDGVGNGLFATLTGIVVADLMRGTGRYNLARGFVADRARRGRVAQQRGRRDHRGVGRLQHRLYRPCLHRRARPPRVLGVHARNRRRARYP